MLAHLSKVCQAGIGIKNVVETHLTDQPDKSGNTTSLGMRILPLGILIVGLGAFFALGLQDYVSFEVLRDNRQQLVAFVGDSGWIAGLLFMALYAVVVAFSLPAGGLMTITAGFLFGSFIATFIVVVGATIGASGLFLAARTALGDALKTRLGPAFEKMFGGKREPV